VIPILFQHLLAKTQPKKRCSMVSISLLLHMTQKQSGCTLKFLLWSILLVLRRSKNTSQAKKLILGVIFYFQMKLKRLGTNT
jgi:hypothetical protein